MRMISPQAMLQSKYQYQCDLPELLNFPEPHGCFLSSLDFIILIALPDVVAVLKSFGTIALIARGIVLL